MPDSSAVDPSQYASHVTPRGLAAAVLGVCIALGACSLLTVVLRAFVRARSKQFGMDDSFMMAGLILFLTDCGVVSYACYVGLGTRNDGLNPVLMLEGIKYVVLWQIFYVTSLCAIKCAICITLLRIAIVRVHRILVWAVIVMTCITSTIGFVGVLTACRPITANWTPGTGECASTDVITNLSYLVSASSIVTDWSCAILPAMILWKTQLRTKIKISVAVVLTLGAVASLTTIARMPFLKYYKQPENDYLYHMGIIIVLSIAECGIGLIAGSLPMLRHLFRAWLGRDEVTESNATPSDSLVTWGRSGSSHNKKRFINPIDTGLSRATITGGRTRSSGEWQKLEDGSSFGSRPGTTKEGQIMEHRAVQVQYEMRNLPSKTDRTVPAGHGRS